MTARRTGIASVAALAGLTLTLGVVHTIAPDWSRRLGLDVWNASAAEADARSADEYATALRVSGDIAAQQIEASDRVGHALATGQMSLTAAVEVLTQINATRDGFQDSLRRIHADAESDRERVARYALGKVWWLLVEEPSRQATAVQKLKGEYAALVGKTWTPAE